MNNTTRTIHNHGSGLCREDFLSINQGVGLESEFGCVYNTFGHDLYALENILFGTNIALLSSMWPER